MSSTMDSLVVKVKHAGTLRRFNVSTTNGNLNLTYTALRSKICELFQITQDKQFSLTYVDEDGDVITMLDDNDLQDAFNQQLNPLRLEVILIGQNSGQAKEPLQNTTNPSTAGEQSQHFNQGASAEEALKNLPDALEKMFTKSIKDNVNFFNVPETSDFAEQAIKFASSYIKPIAEQAVGVTGSKENQPFATENFPVAFSHLVEGALKLASSQIRPTPNDTVQTASGSQGNDSAMTEKTEKAPITVGVSNGNADTSTSPIKHAEKSTDALTEDTPAMEQGINNQPPPIRICPSALKSTDALTEDTPAMEQGVNNQPPPIRICPSALKKSFTENVQNIPYGDNGHHQVIHVGVQCDICGRCPIVGPRYKSMVREDYDLCQHCISQSGNEEEYTRLDRPLYRPPRSFRCPYKGKGIHPFQLSGQSLRIQSMPTHCNNRAANRMNGKLDSRFVQDVTVSDGTQLAPGTSFVKIWRLRNNGSFAWPHQTMLVRVGGDDLGAPDTVHVNIGEEGYPVNEELDVAVDFIAPKKPGRYISYWRLMTASGQKFGQRFWVLIQVIPQEGEEPLPKLMESLLSLNDARMSDPFHAKRKSNDAAIADPLFAQGTTQFADPLFIQGTAHFANENPAKSLSEKSFSGSERMDVDNAFMYPEFVKHKTNDLENSPKEPSGQVDFDFLTPAVGADQSSPNTVQENPATLVVDIPVSAPSLIEVDIVGRNINEVTVEEGNLLRELKDMGFTNRSRNLEILRRNKNDMMRTLDDLCGAAELDTILEELKEMGFNDVDMNRKVLMKNDGSVKRAVLDLLSVEKEMAPGSPSVPKKAKQS